MKSTVKNLVPPKYRMMLGTYLYNLRRVIKPQIKLGRSDKVIIVIASPHKVGSTWLFKIIKDLTGFRDIFPPFRTFKEYRKVRIPLDNLEPYFSQLKGGGRGYIFKSHSAPPTTSNDGIFYVTVIRDPRDIMVSMSHYVSTLPVELGGWGVEFSAKNDRDKLKEVIERSDFIFNLFQLWSKYENCLLLRYEDLKTDIYSCIKEIVTYTNLRVKPHELELAIEKNDFKRLSGRESGDESTRSFYRKGIVGDWKNHFDEELLHFLYTTQNGRWKKLIHESGYQV